MYLLIDNYDSFTYNLVHFLGDLGAECAVWRNDKITVDEVLAQKPQGIVISPGPCDPPKAGICVDLIKAAAENAVPLLGVCLGHQSIGYAFGATVERGPVPMHGKVSPIHHQGIGLFEGLKDPLSVTRYHSLVVAEKNLPDCFRITAQTDDGVIMGMEHKTAPLHGVQFHPESIASEEGHALLNNFLKRTRNDGA
ncbi:aminodeoxychorismate/anthranilate synthase component II [Rhodospirillaceae bacterium KN72]|uniref:Aminodeoxychorismate/anthranilate synthase component II n=1 Tax=Pacificispira spongiicola TaxID=2729598 RepID=A0A7Y0HDU3_9PROT|nr:aminodeoxychorismate/anthranilate synthase component II [Pacificispira spongiicola]NMM44015.1 aminodeoxychorismate/anthranilate synthase component II [Pacificispira spongiicola]